MQEVNIVILFYSSFQFNHMFLSTSTDSVDKT